MRISFGELRIGELARRHLQSALEKDWISEGANVAAFEEHFAALFGYPYAVATSSGTDADIAACASLYGLGAQRGDEIITPALSFCATANAILAAGFTPHFVDVELETLNIDPDQIEAAISDRTAAIMVVHTMGKPADMDPIMEIARRHGLRVIEDACEAHGAQYNGHYVGSIGDIGTFSFYVAHLVCCGEGGMAVTSSPEIEQLLRSVKSHGRPAGDIYFDFQRFGLNSKMNDMEAAVGLEGLSEFPETFRQRREHLQRLLELTDDLAEYVHRLDEQPHELISPHAFPLVLKDPSHDRDKLYRYLEDAGIQCKTLFGSLPTQHAAFAFMGHRSGEFPVAEYIGKNGLHFGCHRYLNDDDLVFAAQKLRAYFEGS